MDLFFRIGGGMYKGGLQEHSSAQNRLKQWDPTGNSQGGQKPLSDKQTVKKMQKRNGEKMLKINGGKKIPYDSAG